MFKRILFLTTLALLLTGCQAMPAPTPATETAAAGDAAPLVLAAHDSFVVSEDVLAAFEAETGITVQPSRSAP